jgi:flavorubredoxin
VAKGLRSGVRAGAARLTNVAVPVRATKNGLMETQVNEIADGIYRLSTHVPDIAPPAGFTFNQFLVADDEPLLFHTGLRHLFPSVRDAVAKVLPPESLRWITFGHVEADESGSMNDWLAVAPNATVAHGLLGCMVSLNDLADRPPRPLANNEEIELGAKRVQHIDTPHVPHNWEARVLYETTTKTLFCGDLFTHLGNGPALVETDIVEPAIEGEHAFQASSLGPTTTSTMRMLAELEPKTLACMHGSSFTGDGGSQLRALADAYDKQFFS